MATLVFFYLSYKIYAKMAASFFERLTFAYGNIVYLTKIVIDCHSRVSSYATQLLNLVVFLKRNLKKGISG